MIANVTASLANFILSSTHNVRISELNFPNTLFQTHSMVECLSGATVLWTRYGGTPRNGVNRGGIRLKPPVRGIRVMFHNLGVTRIVHFPWKAFHGNRLLFLKLRFWTALAIWPEHRKLARYTRNRSLPLMNAGDSGGWPTLSRSLPHAAAI